MNARSPVMSGLVSLLLFLPLVGCTRDTVRPEADVELPPLVRVGDDNPNAAMRARLIAAYEQVEEAPRSAEANGRLGMLYEVSRYPDAAGVSYRRAALLDPDDFRWHYLAARLDFALGRSDRALRGLERTVELRPDYPPAQVKLGELLLEQGGLERATEAFEAAIAIPPGSTSAQLGLGKSLAAAGQHEAAIEAYRRALERAPDYAPIHYALAIAYRELGDTGSAERHFASARDGNQIAPDPDPLLAAVLDLEVGADREYKDAVASLNAGRLDEAIAGLRSLVDRQPGHYAAHGALGRALMLRRRPGDALAAYERAVELNPTNVDFLRPYALLLYGAGRLDDAERNLRAVMDMGGDHHDDHHVLGAVLMKLGRPAEAIQQFERALERKADHREARRALLHLLRRQMSAAVSDLDALPFMRRIVELEPEDVQTWSVLGATLTEAGDLDGALEAFDRALAVNPDLAEVRARRDRLAERIAAGGRG